MSFWDGKSVAELEEKYGIATDDEYSASESDGPLDEEEEFEFDLKRSSDVLRFSMEIERRAYEEAEEEAEQADPLKRRAAERSPTECSICLCEYEDPVRVPECGNVFCRVCLSDYCGHKTMDISQLYYKCAVVNFEKANVFFLQLFKGYGVPCPAYGCKHSLLLADLTRLTNEDVVEKFQRFADLARENRQRLKEMQREQAEAERVRTQLPECPNCQSRENVKMRRRGRAFCSRCDRHFCRVCRLQHSTTLPCNVALERQQRFLEEQRKLGSVAGIIQCPKCTALTTKESGCNFMTCTCGQYFCNICGCGLDTSQHFSHFPDGPFQDKCLGKKDGVKIAKTWGKK